MIGAILLLLLVLWFLGYVRVPGLIIPNFSLFVVNGHPITLWSILIFLLVMWAISILPAPIQTVVGILFILWLISELGILAITGLPSIIVVLLILAIIVSLF